MGVPKKPTGFVPGCLNPVLFDLQRLTHELGRAEPADGQTVDGRDPVSQSEVDELDVEATSTQHDDVVRLNAQMNDAAMVQELDGVQHLDTHTHARTHDFQGCRGYGDSHGDSNGYGYGMGMGTVMNPHGFCG